MVMSAPRLRRARYLWAASIAASLVVVLSAQQPPPPSPQTPTPGAPTPGAPAMPARAGRPGDDAKKGSAIIRGYVVAGDTQAPLRRAMVRAMSLDGRNGGVTTTDAQGRFEIVDLLSGRYSLMATKAGYVSMQYGQRRPEQQGTVLEILEGQLVEKVAFALPRGGVITGRVTDEFGDPVAGAQVSALRSRYANGGRRLVPMGGGATDDLGMFRMYGLAPGEYYVSGVVRAIQMAPQATTTSAAVEGYAPTYFPGTTNPTEASRLTVKVGQETANVTFALSATRLVRVSGRAVSATGEPVAQAMISLTPTDRYAPGMMAMFNNTMTRADGSFQLSGVAAGSYNLTLRPRGDVNANTEFGQARIGVGAEDVDNVVIVTSRGATARGIVTTDENTPLPVRPQFVNIYAQPADMETPFMSGGGPAQVSDDWSFELSGLFDLRYISATIAESPDWLLKAVLLNGQDVTDTPLEFAPGRHVDGLQVVFSRKRTELTGALSDERGRPLTDATVLIFPVDSKHWTGRSRYIRSARPNQEGRYNLRGMPPEDYYLIALREMEPGQFQDPEFLEALRDRSARLKLGEGETRTHDLKVVQQ
jgi:protocatechuate 3,4-dioxygenase beta subunit